MATKRKTTTAASEQIIFWFRRDLRLEDNAGLYHALKQGKPVLPIFIFDTEILDKLDDKSDRRLVFIHQTLEKLHQQLVRLGSGLRVLHGKPLDVWKALAEEFSVSSVYTNHDYEPYARKRDTEIALFLKEKGIELFTYKDQVIFEKDEVSKENGKPYTVFTPYKSKWREKLNPFYLKSYPTETYWGNFSKEPKKAGLPTLESIGFKDFPFEYPVYSLSENLMQHYADRRDIPSLPATSRLSVHLRFGTVSVREIFSKTLPLSEAWTNELIWREFYMQILWHFPQVEKGSFKPEYDRIAWDNNELFFQRWCDGKTGFPLVDAGMRELNLSGFMHNRVRMVAASFLTKHLFIDWRWGEAYFASKLIDYDLSANNGGWQWAAGTGTDAAPYFRIFNPAEQLRKFDPHFVYVKRWVTEFGTASYREPIVDHKWARERCLEGYKKGLGKK